ncbi:MAG TPA: histidine phosphatase family protein [Nocardioides sp.]|jgi:probable phosphoglycerate mutase
MRRLVLLRHGRTAWNLLGRGQGHSDVELDEVGHLQAKRVAPYVAAYQPALLWSSDLLRAARTAEYVAEASGLTPRPDPRLREYSLGERTGLTMDQYAARFPTEYAEFRAGRFSAVPGGETTADVLARFRPALDEIDDQLAPGETGVVVSHGAALKVALLDFLGWPATADTGLRGLDNCGWIELTADDPEPGAREHWRLAAYNLTAPDPDFASGPGVG